MIRGRREPVRALAFCAGNHEIELDSFDNSFQAYTTRYPNAGLKGANNATQGWYSVSYGGVHTISVNPYQDNSVGSAQYKWCAVQHVQHASFRLV